MHTRRIITERRCILPRFGFKFDIKRDLWLPSHPSKRPIWRNDDPKLQAVANLIDSESGLWDQGLVRNSFDGASTSLILKLLPPQQNKSDQTIWADDLNGRFMVKSVTRKEQMRRCPYYMQQDKSL